jgi:hypothetical protein
MESQVNTTNNGNETEVADRLQASRRPLLLTTNVPNAGAIDEALLRRGTSIVVVTDDLMPRKSG